MTASDIVMAHNHAPVPAGVVPLVEVTRGAVVESRHFGAAAVVTAEGDLVGAWGDVEQPVYPRSAIKFFQALPLLETGAADAFALTGAELAVACASHVGAEIHVDAVNAMLGRVGLGEDALACGPRPPVDPAAHDALVCAGRKPGRIHNSCSGKHAGMLLTAARLGARFDGYHRIDHPVQQRVVGVLEQMTGLDLGPVPRAIDGCSLPIWAPPLGNLALALARFADPADQPETRQSAVGRLWQALAAAPEMVEGADARWFVSEVMRLAGGRIAVKNGAEGVFVAAVRDRGLGVAVKVGDGGDRAARVATAALLLRYAAPEGALRSYLEAAAEVPVETWAGEVVGVMRPAAGWLPE